MTVLVAVVLAVLTFTFVVYPLFRKGSRSVYTAEDEKIQDLYSKRDTAYSMLKELEFDFQSGNISEDDYRDLEARYKRKAISILRDIDHLKMGDDVEEEIERQVLKLRQDKGPFCSQCGTRYQEGDRFCARCGARLSRGEGVD